MPSSEGSRQLPGGRAFWAPVSAGELLDKLTILELKDQRLTEPLALENVRRELTLLRCEAAREGLLDDPNVAALTDQLRRVNGTLWQIEAGLRSCERTGEFGEPFVLLARSVYRYNDQRAALKRQLNLLLGSILCEEKSYHEPEHEQGLSAC